MAGVSGSTLRGCVRVVAMLALLAVCVSSVSGAVGSASAAGGSAVVAGSLTGAIDPQFVGTQGETFYTATLAKVVYTGGPLYLSSTSNGLTSTLVDDALTIKIVRPDGTTSSYTHDYSGGCGPDVPMAPKDLSSKFQPGENKVTLMLKDKCGGGESSSALWLTPQSHVYWTNFNADPTSIGRASIDGTDVNQTFISGADQTTGQLAADASFLYWYNNDGHSIARANLDGTGVDLNFIGGASSAGLGVAVDANYIYWTRTQQGVGRANLDGTGVSETFISDPAAGGAMAVDAAHIYWPRDDGLGNTGIARANLDGTGVNTSFMTNVAAVRALAVDAHHIYWDQGKKIGRASIDGTHVNKSFIHASNTVDGIAVDAGHIYWLQNLSGSEWEVGRANIDGTGVNQSFISGTLGSFGIALDTPAPPPMLSSPGPNPAVGFTSRIDNRLADALGETFFTATVSRVSYSGGPMFLAGSKDGTASTLVDDALKIKVVHQDGTSSTYTHDYSGGCGPDTPLAPTNIA